MAHPKVLGREYTCLSAACGPDQSTSNKVNMELRAARSNEQTALFFVRFQAVLHVIFSKFGLGRRNLHKTVTGVHLCERVVLSSAIHPEALMAESPRAPASNTGSAILATTY